MQHTVSIMSWHFICPNLNNLEPIHSQVFAQLPFKEHCSDWLWYQPGLKGSLGGFPQVTAVMFCFILLLVSCSLCPDLTLSLLNAHYGSRCVKLRAEVALAYCSQKLRLTGFTAAHAGPSENTIRTSCCPNVCLMICSLQCLNLLLEITWSFNLLHINCSV